MVHEGNSSPNCGWLKCCRVGPEPTEYQSEPRRVLIDRQLVSTPIRECLPPPAESVLYQYRCGRQCLSANVCSSSSSSPVAFYWCCVLFSARCCSHIATWTNGRSRSPEGSWRLIEICASQAVICLTQSRFSPLYFTLEQEKKFLMWCRLKNFKNISVSLSLLANELQQDRQGLGVGCFDKMSFDEWPKPWHKTAPFGSSGYLCGCTALKTIW